MSEYRLYWKDGTSEILSGRNIADAFNSQYSAGALAVLDYYELVEDDGEDIEDEE